MGFSKQEHLTGLPFPMPGDLSNPGTETLSLVSPELAGFFTTDFPGGLDSKASVYSVGDLGSIPGSEDPLEKEMAIHSSTIAW